MNLQNDEHDYNTDLDGVIRQDDEYDENKLLFWIIFLVLLFLSLIFSFWEVVNLIYLTSLLNIIT